MKTLVGTGDNPEREDGYKPSAPKKYTKKTLGTLPKQGAPEERPNPYSLKPISDEEAKKKYYGDGTKPKIPERKFQEQEQRPNPYGYRPKSPGEYQPLPADRIMKAKKIKSTIRGGMGAGRGDNPNYYPDGNYYHG